MIVRSNKSNPQNILLSGVLDLIILTTFKVIFYYIKFPGNFMFSVKTKTWLIVFEKRKISIFTVNKKISK